MVGYVTQNLMMKDNINMGAVILSNSSNPVIGYIS